MKNIVIVAHDLNNAIGKDGRIPWHIPEDLAHFKKETTGHAVVMGRKTFESLPRPLENRLVIVLTSSFSNLNPIELKGAIAASNVYHALDIAFTAGYKKCFWAGGEAVYKEALRFADEIYRTIVMQKTQGADTYFPAMPTGYIRTPHDYQSNPRFQIWHFERR